MDEKSLSLDLVVKSSNLCRYLMEEKSENLISQKFFDSVCLLSECAFSLKNPLFSKNEVALLRKEAAMAADKINLYLDAIYMSGLISAAQKESMVQTLNTLKKEINI